MLLSQCCLNDANNILGIPKYLLIAEAQHLKTETFQKFLSKRVLLGCVLVNCAINFNNQIGFITEEIHDKAINGVLTAKLRVQLSISESLPQMLLSSSWFAPHLSGKRFQLRPEFR